MIPSLRSGEEPSLVAKRTSLGGEASTLRSARWTLAPESCDLLSEDRVLHGEIGPLDPEVFNLDSKR